MVNGRWLRKGRCGILVLVLLSALAVIPSYAAINTWTSLGPEGGHIYFLAIAPSAIYAVIGNGICKSINGGASWAEINTGLTNRMVTCLAIDPVSHSTIYAGTWGGGIFKSINGGNSWFPVNTGLTDSHVQTLAINPSTPSIIYAGTFYGSGVFKSSNGGATGRS